MQSSSEAKLDRDGFDTLALANIDSIYRFALYMIQDDKKAQDLVLYTFLNACKSLDRYDHKTSCRIWLLAILNDAITKISPILTGASGRDNLNIAGVVVRRFSGIRFGEIAVAMSELPASDRAIVILSDMEGLSYEDIASIVGSSVEDVSSRLFRGRKLLIERLKATLNSRSRLHEQS